MRYVPNLIAEKWKVLPGYFTGDVYQARKANPILNVLGWIFGLLLLLIAMASLNHPPLAVIFGLFGFMLLPPGHQWLEKTLRFRFTSRAKTIVGTVLFIGVLPVSSHYAKLDAAAALLERQQAELAQQQAEQKKLIAEKKEQQRKDSLAFYFQKSTRLSAAHKTDLALKQLVRAIALAATPAEETQLTKARIKLASVEIGNFMKVGRYQAAIPKLGELLVLDGSNADLLYSRAACYSHIGKMQLAVNDCKAAKEHGSKAATSLYDKINPVRRQIIGYVTRCCDGSTSGATGRGACSHHGGVCNWQDPIYTESRKYE